jgi:ferredoxin
VITAPAVFDQRDEDGVVVVLAESPPPTDHALVREAMMACPTGAISIEDDGTR